jgi:hypothetical protein
MVVSIARLRAGGDGRRCDLVKVQCPGDTCEIGRQIRREKEVLLERNRGRFFRRFETNGTKKDVILKNEPKKLFKFNKRLH